MRSLKLLDNLIDVMGITLSDHDISYNEIQNVYRNLYKKEPELFADKNNKDNKWGWTIIKKADKQYRYRCYVRTVFSCIEGLNYRSKRIAFNEYKYCDNVEMKKEAKPFFKMLAINKLSFEDTIKHTFRLINIIGSSYKVDFGNQNWKNFTDSIKIRHRITHPKTKKSFYLTKTNVEDVKNAYEWFVQELGNVIKHWE